MASSKLQTVTRKLTAKEFFEVKSELECTITKMFDEKHVISVEIVVDWTDDGLETL